MSEIITRDGDMLDELLWQHLGTDAQIAAGFEANPGLAALGPVLPAGLRVRLPEARPLRQGGQVRLWGKT